MSKLSEEQKKITEYNRDVQQLRSVTNEPFVTFEVYDKFMDRMKSLCRRGDSSNRGIRRLFHYHDLPDSSLDNCATKVHWSEQLKYGIKTESAVIPILEQCRTCGEIRPDYSNWKWSL